MIHAYPIGTEVQNKKGNVKKKVSDGKWIGRNRHNWERAHKQDLTTNQKVYHINGDKADDTAANLVAITFSGKVYSLSHSRVLWVPKVVKNQHGALELVKSK